MPNTKSEGHIDQYLSNVSISYIQSQEKFIASKVFPVVSVAKQSDIFITYPRGYFWRDQIEERPLGGESPRIEFKTDTDKYYAIEEGVSSDMDDRERANAMHPYNPEASRIKMLTQQHLIHRDKVWANTFFKAGVWTHDLLGVASSPSTAKEFTQFDNVNSTPIECIDELKDLTLQRTGFEPNTMVVGRKAFRKLKNHPDIIDRIKYTARGIITQDLLKEMFGVSNFLVPGGIMTTNAETADSKNDDFDFIVPQKGILLCYAAPSPGLDQPSAGYTFSWAGISGVAGFEAVVNRGRNERAHSDWFEVRMASDQKVVAKDLGIFLNEAVA